MAKRTKAQRVAAAKASWERRRKGLPPLSKQRGKKRRGKPAPFMRPEDMVGFQPVAVEAKTVMVTAPVISYAVAEGDDVFVCFGVDGSLNRQKLSRPAAAKLLRELTAILV